MLFANRICRSVLAIVCVRVSVMTGAADQHDKALLSLHVDDARMYTVQCTRTHLTAYTSPHCYSYCTIIYS